MPTHNSQLPTKKIAREERRDKVMALARAAFTTRQIAGEVGCSANTVSRDIRHRIAEQIRECEDTKLLRQREIDRLDELLRRWWRRAMDEEPALDRVLKILDMRSRYLGIDIPREVHHTADVNITDVRRIELVEVPAQATVTIESDDG